MADPAPHRTEIEVVADDGPRADGARPGRSRVGPAVSLIGVAAAAALALTLLADDPPPAPPDPAPGIFDLAAVDATDSPASHETTYPVLDRQWGETVLWVQQQGIVAFDLDTGLARLWLPSAFPQGAWNGVSLIDGVTYVTFGRNGVARVDADGITVVHADNTQGGVAALTGEYLDAPFSNAPAPALVHLPSGTSVDLGEGRRFAVLGESVLIEREGTIHVAEPGRSERFWARGELVARGRNAAIFRSCDADGRCRSWAGTVADPEATELDDATVESRLDLLGPRSPTAREVPDIASPDGRFALGADVPRLNDLIEGSAVEIRQVPVGWSVEGNAFAADFSPGITIVSMDDGALARLPILADAGARWRSEIVFVPTADLPDLG